MCIRDSKSTNDSVFVMANGASGTSEINKDSIAANDFQDALSYVCIQLAKELVKELVRSHQSKVSKHDFYNHSHTQHCCTKT